MHEGTLSFPRAYIASKLFFIGRRKGQYKKYKQFFFVLSYGTAASCLLFIIIFFSHIEIEWEWGRDWEREKRERETAFYTTDWIV